MKNANVGCYGAKVLKIKQITTKATIGETLNWLDAMVQRY